MNEETKQYNKIAKLYQETEEVIQKKYIVQPSFFNLCGNVENLSVLDLACGSGYFTRLLKQKGANRVVGIDISEEEIKIAREIEKRDHLGIDYVIGDVADFNLSDLGSFDLATAAFLLHYAQTKEHMEGMCQNIFQALKKNSRFVTINSHPEIPIFLNPKYKVISYVEPPLEEGKKRKVTYFSDSGQEVSFFTRYWFRETYENALKQAGFKDVKWVDAIVSKEGKKEHGQDFWQLFLENPSLICLEARKI
ncbi:MAG: class I SAM-dependent methyltransferase [Nanoarchaeota archaeon]|nr:class I SAM-dependent methyltransferase [Nanoarchaeota archaeon]